MRLRKGVYIVGIVVAFLLGIFIGKTWRSSNEKETEINLLSDNAYQNLEVLKTYVDYAIETYCDETGKTNTYRYNIIDDMLHHDTIISQEEYFSFDLNKEITPELVNNKYFFKVTGSEDVLYVVIDTYRMKIYVYEYIKGITIVRGGNYDESITNEDLEQLVKSDWEDMWSEEYSSFTLNGWEYLTTPDLDEIKRQNPDLYGMVIYSLQRYCEEKGIVEQFSFDFAKDEVSSVTYRVFTVKVQSSNRILYMDIDMDRNRVHIYQVE